MTRDQFDRGILSCARNWEREVPARATLDVWYNRLSYVPYDLWVRCVQDTIDNEDHWPRVAAFRRHLDFVEIENRLRHAEKKEELRPPTDEERHEGLACIRDIIKQIDLGEMP